MTEPVDIPESETPSDEERQRFSLVRDPVQRIRAGLTLLLVLFIGIFLALGLLVLRVLTPAGRPVEGASEGITWVRSIYGWGVRESQQLHAPSDVAIAPNGTIWVSDPQRWQVLGFNPDGSYRSIIHEGPGAMMPQVIAVSESGYVYVGDNLTNQVRVFDEESNELRQWRVPLPTEIAVKDGIVAVGMVNGLTVFDETGKVLATWNGRGSGRDQFNVVRGIVIGDDGTIYLSDTQNHRIKAYDVKTGLKWVYPQARNERAAGFANKGQAEGKGESPYQIPAGMTFDNAGRLLVADPFEFRVDVVDPENGTLVGSYGEFGEKDGFFAYPTSIAYDASRDWFAVADTANDRVQIIRIEGSGGSLAQAARRAADRPLWVLLIPLTAIVVTVFVRAVARRRGQRAG